MSRWKRDVIYSIAILIFCAVHWVLASNLQQHVVNVELAKPSVYSHLVLGILGILAIAQLVRALVKKPDEQLEPIWSVLAVITIVTLLIYVAVIDFLGFQLSTFLAMAVVVTSYTAGMHKIDWSNKKKMVRQIAVCILIALAISVSTELIFRTGLGAKLPTGTLF